MPDRIIELYDRTALACDAARGQTLGAERVWMDRLTARIPIGGTILDLGCGTGDPVARAFLQQGFRITGVDSSPNLVAIAKGRLPEAEWIVADMRRLDLKRQFDAVLAWHSFFHLTQDDQRRMFPVFAAHTAPGGALMFTSGPRAGPSIGEWQGEPLFHDSLDPAEYKELLATFGFELRQHIAEDPESGGATVWLADKSVEQKVGRAH